MTARARLCGAVVALLLLLTPRDGVEAQATCNGGATCTVTVSLRLARPEVFRLVLSTVSTPVPALTAADFTLGHKDVAGPVLTVFANAPHRITVQAAAPLWQYAGAAPNPGKAASDLFWSRDANGAWLSSGTAATLWPVSGPSAPPSAGQTIPLFYRTRWHWTGSPPGTYTLPVNITLTSP